MRMKKIGISNYAANFNILEISMKWNEYESNYIGMARLNNRSDEYCVHQLEYAKKLFDNHLPIIYNQQHLCKLVGYQEGYVYAVANQSWSFYKIFQIPKKNGGFRTIQEPLPSLKEIQEWIYHEILCNVRISPYAKAYVKGKSIKDNARFHRGQKKVLSMDLKDFFPSIDFKQVLGVFRKLGYRENVAVMLAKLCCVNNSLPQGAPTSPALSNIIACKLDDKIVEYIGKKKIRYTRYADDLTFSGDFNEGDIIKNVQRIANRLGFYVNEEKTRVRKRNQRQEVTGVVVNEKLQLSRKIRKRIRSDIYYIRKYGLESHLEYTDEKRENYLYHLMGMVSYGVFINPYDEKLKEYRSYLNNLLRTRSDIRVPGTIKSE